ncbi:MAG: hypothetical protein HS130_05140 [Deltaproteobacteria bacterium]|nr:hypothetical protein [Deltaproteobacteria bacterium]
MQNEKEKNLNRILIAVAAVMVALFSITLFKHISYPLLWNDGGDTAMFATRILEYGFPKVHDGKNVVYVHVAPMSIGVNKHDMYTADLLLTYYWAAGLAHFKAGDIYKDPPFQAAFRPDRPPWCDCDGARGPLLKNGTKDPYWRYFLFAVLRSRLPHLRESALLAGDALSACILYAYISHRFASS